MRILLMVFTVMLVGTMTFDADVFGQSGSRSSGSSAGASRGGGGGRSSGRSSGGGFSGARGSSSRGSSSRNRPVLSPAEQELLRQRQLLQQQELLKLQEESNKAAQQQQLIQLGLNPNSSLNREQNRLVFQQAKNDFKALRQRRISPDQLGLLQQPFRLRSDSIDRERRKVKWPVALRNKSSNSELDSLVEKIDSTITNATIKDLETATAFLNELNQFNTVLNSAAARGEIDSKDYARSRRLASGLANEILSSKLFM